MSRVPVLRSIAVLSLTLAACTVPDTSEEFGKAQAALSALSPPIDGILAKREAEALARQLDTLLAQGAFIYAPSEACALVANNGFSDNPCVAQEDFRPNEQLASYRKARAVLREMTRYLDALGALAGSNRPEQIAAQSRQVFAQLEAISDTIGTLLPQSLVLKLLSRQTSAPLILQFAAEQARGVALRRAVRAGDDAIEVGVLTLIAHLRSEKQGDLPGRLKELAKAETAMNNARKSGDAGRYRKALDEFQQAIARLEAERQGTLFGQLQSFRQAHRNMAEALLGPASLPDIRNVIQSVSEIEQALEMEEQS